MPLTPAVQEFIVHWGEMGTQWGINRTVAQIHALLCLMPEPLTAEQIAASLRIARSNVSTSLNELKKWGLLEVSSRLGDRKEYFTSNQSVWNMFTLILDERKKREIDPTLTVLRQCADAAATNKEEDAYTRKRINEYLEFMEAMTSWYGQLRKMPVEQMLGLASLPKKLIKAIKG